MSDTEKLKSDDEVLKSDDEAQKSDDEVLKSDDETFTTSEKKENRLLNFIKEYVPFLLLLIAILLFKKYLYSPLYVHGDSMLNTLHDGDIMILDIVGFKSSGLERFDIVVVNNDQELIIKRVIGLPGEIVEYRNNRLYINGEYVYDSYGSSETEDFRYVIPNGEYFVLGDNRGNSLDSRYFGSFSEDKIMGKTKLVLFPFNRFGDKE